MMLASVLLGRKSYTLVGSCNWMTKIQYIWGRGSQTDFLTMKRLECQEDVGCSGSTCDPSFSPVCAAADTFWLLWPRGPKIGLERKQAKLLEPHLFLGLYVRSEGRSGPSTWGLPVTLL